jgi:hypothetical protein
MYNILKPVLEMETETKVETALTSNSICENTTCKIAPASFLFRVRSQMILHIFYGKQ